MDAKGNTIEGINGNEFANEMEFLQNMCDKITVRINSPGGNVMEGYAIASSILHSKKPVHTIIDGVAASTAGWIAACGSERSIIDYGSFMAHNSTGGDKDMTSFINKTINTMLAGRSGKTNEDIETMMNKETWLNAKEAKDYGFIDNIISSGRKIKLPKNSSAEELALICNKLINPKNMSKLNTLLKISNSAEESEQEIAVAKLNSDLEASKTENESLKAEIAKRDDAEKLAKETALADLTNKANTLVEKAIAEKKITEAEKKSYVDLAITNISLVENMFSKIGSVSNQTASKIFNAANHGSEKPKDDRSNWTIRDWETKDVKGLASMKNETPDVYNDLFTSFYKK
jgi:ATP-dependent Clp protease protease subunit